MTFNINKVKIVVTVPEENLSELRESVCKVGAGVIGTYTFCTNSSKVLGTFTPSNDSNPYIGTKNKLEFVSEERLEFVCDISKVKLALDTIKKVHPYETPAIDIIPLIDEQEFNKM